MCAIIISEIHADGDRICAFLADGQRLATALRAGAQSWLLRMAGEQYRCADIDAVRQLVRGQWPGRAAAFERRTIRPRHHYHGRLSTEVISAGAENL